MSDEKHSRHAAHHRTDFFRERWRGRIGKVKRYFQEQHAKRAREEPERKAARNTARATVVIAFFTIALAVVGWLQYQEVQDSSDAMDRMNRIYRAQAAQLGRQAGETHDLAIAAGKQADASKALSERTKTIADQAIIQAAAAQSAADTAKDTLHVSERAYVIAEEPTFDFSAKAMMVPLEDSGHLPSGITVTTVHEATFNVANVTDRFSLQSPSENSWEHTVWDSIVPGSHQSIGVVIPLLEQDRINSGTQSVIVAGTISYNDGFAGTPDRQWKFCFRTVFQSVMKKSFLIDCNPEDFLPQLEKADGYPNNEHKD